MSDRRRMAARFALLLVGSPLCCVPLLLLPRPLAGVLGVFVGPLVGRASVLGRGETAAVLVREGDAMSDDGHDGCQWIDEIKTALSRNPVPVKVEPGQWWRYVRPFSAKLKCGSDCRVFQIVKPKLLETGVVGWTIRLQDGAEADLGPTVWNVAERVNVA